MGFGQGWLQKSYYRGAGDSNSGAKMVENAVLVHHFAKFPPAGSQNFLPTGGGLYGSDKGL